MPRRPVSSRSPGVSRKRSWRISSAKIAWSADAGPHRAHLVDDQAGGARGGDGRVGDELRAEHPAEHPDDAERRDGRERPAAVAGRDPGQAKHRQRREDEHGDDEHRRAGDGQVRVRPADRVAQRLDADPGVAPVVDRVERPVEGREEADVEDLHDHQQAEHRPDDPGQEAPRGRRAGRGRARGRRGPRAGAARTRRA